MHRVAEGRFVLAPPALEGVDQPAECVDGHAGLVEVGFVGGEMDRRELVDAHRMVGDHGPGVDPAEIDNIFLPFYRPQTSRGRDGRGGAGLGLAITQQVIDRFDGTVAVEATPGGGATFTLVVPLATR